MRTDTWKCSTCGRLGVQLPGGYRGNKGHMEDVCAGCSTEIAEVALRSSDMAVRWLVDKLRGDLKAERKDRADDVRWYQQEARD